MQSKGDPTNQESSLTNCEAYHNNLCKAISDNDSALFEQLFNQIKDSDQVHQINSPGQNEPTLLQYACQRGALFAVDGLIQSGVDPNETSKSSSWPPLLEAAAEGNAQVLERLVKADGIDLNVKDAVRLTALHKVTQKLIYSKSDERSRYLKCLRVLLSAEKPIDVNARDKFNNTPLHFATLSGVEEATEELLRHGAHLSLENDLGETALKRMSPSALESYFDSCISLHDDGGPRQEFYFTFNYSVLAPVRHTANVGSNEEAGCTRLCIGSTQLDGRKVNPEYETIWHLSASEKHRHLLKHPLITSFLALKWRNVRTLYFINLGIYTASVLSLTAFMLLLHSGWSMDHISGSLNILWCLSAFFVTMLLAREAFHFGVAPLCYLFSPENWAIVVMLIFSTLVLSNWKDPAPQRPFSAFAILLAWIEGLLLLGRHPRFAIFVTTFKIVTCSFFRLLLCYSTLFFGFGFSFFLVFGGETTENSTGNEKKSDDKPDFPNIYDSLLRLLPMMIGEFDFKGLPLDLAPCTSRLIFVAFVFLITIVLLNVLNGFAVSDTQGVISKAEILCYVSQVEMTSYVESILLGDPYEFLANWSSFSYLWPKYYFSSPILCCFRTALLNGFIPARRAILFYECLPNKALTVFPLRRLDRISTIADAAADVEICDCHREITFDEHIIDSAIQRARAKRTEASYRDILNKFDEFRASFP